MGAPAESGTLHLRAAARATLAEVAEAAREARPFAPVVLALAAATAFLHGPTLRYLWNAWTVDPYYGHGLLVPLLVAWLAWRARHRAAAAPAERLRARNLWGYAAPVALYLGGVALYEPFLFALSVMALVPATMLYLVGPQRARHVAPPTALLALAVPVPGLLEVGVLLQGLAAWGAVKVLGLGGIAVVEDGFTLLAGGRRFEVAPLCSGLSSVLSIVTLAVAYAATRLEGAGARVALVVAAVPMALAANVLRVSLLVAVGVRWGEDATRGLLLHGGSDLVLFLVALAGVVGIRALLARRAGVARDG